MPLTNTHTLSSHDLGWSALARALTMQQTQLLLLMARNSLSVCTGQRITCTYVCYDLGRAGSGYVYIDPLLRVLNGTGMLHQNNDGSYGLSDRGKQFADWLEESGIKADFFSSDEGEWGSETIDPLGLASLSQSSDLAKPPTPKTD